MKRARRCCGCSSSTSARRSFAKASRRYLKKHQYANTETSDLWDALEEAVGQPVRKMMDSWIFQPGFPIIERRSRPPTAAASSSGSGGFSSHGTENRATALARAGDDSRADRPRASSLKKLLLTETRDHARFGGKVEWALLNEGGHGFYRVHYSPELLAALTTNLDALAADRALRPGQRYLGRDGRRSVAADRVPQDGAPVPRRDRHQCLARADRRLQLPRHDRDRKRIVPRWRRKVARSSDPRFARLGWDAEAGRRRIDAPIARRLDRRARHDRRRSQSSETRARSFMRAGEDNPAQADRDHRSRPWSRSSPIPAMPRATRNSRTSSSRRARRRKNSATCSRSPISAIRAAASRRWRCRSTARCARRTRPT